MYFRSDIRNDSIRNWPSGARFGFPQTHAHSHSHAEKHSKIHTHMEIHRKKCYTLHMCSSSYMDRTQRIKSRQISSDFCHCSYNFAETRLQKFFNTCFRTDARTKCDAVQKKKHKRFIEYAPFVNITRLMWRYVHPK